MLLNEFQIVLRTLLELFINVFQSYLIEVSVRGCWKFIEVRDNLFYKTLRKSSFSQQLKILLVQVSKYFLELQVKGSRRGMNNCISDIQKWVKSDIFTWNFLLIKAEKCSTDISLENDIFKETVKISLLDHFLISKIQFFIPLLKLLT